MTTPASIDPHRPLVDIRDMIVVHTAMLREFRLIPAAIRRVPVGNSKRAVIVADQLVFLCDLLHHHHRGEDELLWPKLRSRTEPQALEVIEEVEAQHESIDSALHEVEDRRLAWIENQTAESRERLAAELERLTIMLADHLDLEERALLPLAAMVLTVDEWHAVGAAGAASIRKAPCRWSSACSPTKAIRPC